MVEPGTLVVIVDDDRELASSVSDFLTLEGYEVRPFATAETALALIAGGLAPSLVILDLWIPTMGAAEFLRRLRRFTPSTPVLLLSGAVPDLERAGLDANAVLAKPAEPTSLVRVVDKLITSHKPRRPPVRAAARRP